jgi:hypothetical protein
MTAPRTLATRADGQRPRRIDLALVLWPSFLAACGASLLFFAAVDPVQLRDGGPLMLRSLDRDSGYALGFFFFWGVGAIASSISLFLVRSERPGRR